MDFHNLYIFCVYIYMFIPKHTLLTMLYGCFNICNKTGIFGYSGQPASFSKPHSISTLNLGGLKHVLLLGGVKGGKIFWGHRGNLGTQLSCASSVPPQSHFRSSNPHKRMHQCHQFLLLPSQAVIVYIYSFIWKISSQLAVVRGGLRNLNFIHLMKCSEWQFSLQWIPRLVLPQWMLWSPSTVFWACLFSKQGPSRSCEGFETWKRVSETVSTWRLQVYYKGWESSAPFHKPSDKVFANNTNSCFDFFLAQGYGLVGLTRGHRVRRRLRALKNSLAITLGRLAKDHKPNLCGCGCVLEFAGFNMKTAFMVRTMVQTTDTSSLNVKWTLHSFQNNVYSVEAESWISYYMWQV